MKLRNEQIEAFDDASLPAFEDFMVGHLREFTPLHWGSLGEQGIRGLIRQGLGQAQKHGFTRRGPARFYIETTILLGVAFDTDPQYPWVAAILRDPSIPDQVERANRVHAWLMGYLDAAGGPDRQYAKQALRRAREIPIPSLKVSSPNFTEEALFRMKENHPEKAAFLGGTILRNLIPRVLEEAQKYQVCTDAGVCLFLGLMFTVGHGVALDPKYPWVTNTLTNAAITDPDRRVERLYSKTMTYLEYVLGHFAL